MMTRIRILFFLLVFFYVSASGQLKPGQIQPSNVPSPSQHYVPEYTFDQPSDPSSWKKVKPGLNAAFATTDELYLRSEVPKLQSEATSWEDTGWRGERLNAQVL